MDRAHQASSNDYRVFYTVQDSIDVMRTRFNDKGIVAIPAGARREFLARVRDAYNTYVVIDDAVEMITTARHTIKRAQQVARTEGSDAAAEILAGATI